MPLGIRPSCSVCKTSISSMWRKDDTTGSVMCNSCYLNQLVVGNKEDSQSVASDNDSSHSGSTTYLKSITLAKQESLAKETAQSSNVRKSTRIKPSSKSKSQQKNPFKGKSRRIIFKRKPMKSHVTVSTIITRDSVFYKGMYYQTGDVVSLLDHSGDIYFAQIRGLLQDQYCEKSAIITWLIPTTATKCQDEFDPNTFILGPEEEIPRKLEYMEFVCHATSSYFKDKKQPRLPRDEPDMGFIWTSIGPKLCKVPSFNEIFGTSPPEND